MAILDTMGKSEKKKTEEKGYSQVESCSILTSVQQENQSHHKNNICWKHRLKREHWRHLHTFWFKISIFSHKLPYRFSIKPANTKKPGVIYITAPKHVFDELVKLNGVEYKGKLLFIDNVKVKPTVTNPN